MVTSSCGSVATSTEDGIVAIFDRPSRAVAAALDLRAALAVVNLEIRSGVHVGEIDIRPDDINGLAVPVAQPIQSVAPNGSVLVSQLVLDLLLGSGFETRPAGVHRLKGVPGDWPLHEVLTARAAGEIRSVSSTGRSRTPLDSPHKDAEPSHTRRRRSWCLPPLANVHDYADS